MFRTLGPVSLSMLNPVSSGSLAHCKSLSQFVPRSNCPGSCSTQRYSHTLNKLSSQTKPRGYHGNLSQQLSRIKTKLPQNPNPMRFSQTSVKTSKSPVAFSSVKKYMSTAIVPCPPETTQIDVGLRRFLSRVFLRTGLGIAGTVGLAAALAPVAMELAPQFLGGGLLLALASCIGVTMIKPEIKSVQVSVPKTSETQEVLYAKDKPFREVCFAGLIGSMALGLAPMMQIITEISPMIVPISLGLTSAIFGGCWLVSKWCSDLQMMQWRAPLMIGLGTLVGGGLLSIGSMLIWGPNMFSAMWQTIDIYGGIALFTGMSIYDMHAAVKMYQEKNPDHIGCATNLYLDFLNLLIRIMEAIGKAKQK